MFPARNPNPNTDMKLLILPKKLTVFLSHAKVFWKQWDVQSMVLTSFIIQLILIFIVPFRKQTSNWVIITTVWLSYLLADWVAIQSIGLISDPCSSTSTSDKELYAFWAQFLLLHLGGPDTITALALEDNELWLRTGLHLGVQVYGGLGILVKSVTHSHTSLWLPTLLMFIAGVIKYSERISSLFRARLSRLYEVRPKIQWTLSTIEDKTDAELKYMSTRTPEQAFQVLEIVFNVAYEVLYTKTVLICTKMHWKVLRLVVTLLQAGCLVIWLFFTDKGGFKDYNIRVTYILLVGAIAVDVYSFLRIQLWSDWTIVLRDPRKQDLLLRFHNKVLSARKRTWGRYKRQEDAPLLVRFRRAFFRRWSDSIPQLSLLSLFMDEQPNKVLGFVTCVGVGSGLEQRKYVRKRWFSDYVRDFLFEDIKEKVNTEGGAENIGKVKGGWACVSLMSNYQTDMISIPNICKLLDTRQDYYFIVMSWHIITELCYLDDQLSHDIDTSDQDDNLVKRLFNKMLSKPNNGNATTTNGSGNKNNGKECDYREICKILSDYMMYLLIHQPDMVSLPAFNKLILGWTYKYLKKKLKEDLSMAPAQRKSEMRHHACWKIGELIEPFFTPQGGETNRQVVGELKELEEKQIGKWKFIAKVWSELLCYAAFQCNPCLHAAKLKQGGELLSFIWMLLYLMGIHMTESPASIHRVELGKALLYTPVNDSENLDRFDSDEV